MYTILVSENNELITTVRERIMQRSKLVDNLHFLMEPTYKGLDMTKFTTSLEFITPVGRELKTEILTQSPELYKGQIEFKLPIDTVITREAGDVELQLSFVYVEMDTDGHVTQHVRKTSPTTLTIIPVANWSTVIGDDALTAIDKRLVELDARIKALDDLSAEFDATKADDIVYNEEDNTLQLLANDQLIGQKVHLKGSGFGIVEIRIDEDGNLVAVYSDGTEEVVGKTSGNCVGTYIPSMKEDIMTFTLSNNPTEPVISFDIDKDNNWRPIEEAGQTDYIWNEL